MCKYYIGHYKKDAVEGGSKGWIVGSFMKDRTRYSEEVEVKYWGYKAGMPSNHPKKVSDTIEITFIIKGKTRCQINRVEVSLSAGDYIVIKPGTENNTVAEILEDTEGITIKAPSNPKAKHIIN